jgi:hypothetical protein
LSGPAAITYGGALHVYVTGDNGHLYDHYWDGARWHFDDHGNFGSSLRGGRPAPVTYHGHLHVFVTGANGDLYDHWWDGAWHWTDLRGNYAGADPAAISYGGYLHVFVTGGGGYLTDFWTDERGWHENGHGNGGAGVFGRPAAITYGVNLYGGDLHVYVRGWNGHLFDHWWDGGRWHWDDHGNGGSYLFSGPAAINYANRLHVYVTGHDNGHLYDHWWDGARWHWDDHGNADRWGGSFHGTPAAIAFANRLHVYVTGDNGHLYDHWWDGSWHWDDHGNGGAIIRSDPATVTYAGSLHVYVAAWDGHLYDHWWNGSWHFDDHGSGGSGPGASGSGGGRGREVGPARPLPQSPGPPPVAAEQAANDFLFAVQVGKKQRQELLGSLSDAPPDQPAVSLPG